MSNTLPTGFEQLEPFAADWALATQNERSTKRRAASPNELKAFYNAVFPEVQRILEACDKFPVGSLPPSHQPLFNLSLSVAEVSPHVENYGGSPDVPFAFEETRFLSAHGDHATWRSEPPSRG